VEEWDHVHATIDDGGISQCRTGLHRVQVLPPACRLWSALSLRAGRTCWPGRGGPCGPRARDSCLSYLSGALTNRMPSPAYSTDKVCPCRRCRLVGHSRAAPHDCFAWCILRLGHLFSAEREKSSSDS